MGLVSRKPQRKRALSPRQQLPDECVPRTEACTNALAPRLFAEHAEKWNAPWLNHHERTTLVSSEPVSPDFAWGEVSYMLRFLRGIGVEVIGIMEQG